MKYVCLIGLFAFCCGCTYHIELEDLNNTSKLVLYTFPGNLDTTLIQVSASVPVSNRGGKQPVVSDAELSYLVNGRERVVKRADDYLPGDGQGVFYYVLGKFSPGDRVQVKAGAAGLPVASAQTEVPEACSLNDVRMIKKPGADGSGYKLQIQASFRDNPAQRNYYGLVVEKRFEYWEENDPFEPWYNVTVKSLELELDDEPLLKQSSALDELFFYFDETDIHFYAFTDEKIAGKEYTLHLNTYYSPNEDKYYDDVYYSYYHFQYRVTLFSLSPEYYAYIKNLTDLKNNELGSSGLAPIRPTYSNVANGLGVAGGFMMAQSEWLDNL